MPAAPCPGTVRPESGGQRRPAASAHGSVLRGTDVGLGVGPAPTRRGGPPARPRRRFPRAAAHPAPGDDGRGARCGTTTGTSRCCAATACSTTSPGARPRAASASTRDRPGRGPRAGDVDDLEVRPDRRPVRRGQGRRRGRPARRCRATSWSAITRRYASEILPIIGPERDIPAPDVGTDEQTMAWMMDTYSIHSGYTVHRRRHRQAGRPSAAPRAAAARPAAGSCSRRSAR